MTYPSTGLAIYLPIYTPTLRDLHALVFNRYAGIFGLTGSVGGKVRVRVRVRGAGRGTGRGRARARARARVILTLTLTPGLTRALPLGRAGAGCAPRIYSASSADSAWYVLAGGAGWD